MVEIVVGPPPSNALELEEVEDAEELADAVHEACARFGAAAVSMLRGGPPNSPGGITLTSAFSALAAAASKGGGTVTCYVATDAIRTRLLTLSKASEARMERFAVGNWEVMVRAGDITAVVADAVVNASNTRLRLGAGISGALARVCGPNLQREMDRIGGVSERGIAVTGAHELRTTSRILHVPTASGDRATVRAALENVLRYCIEHKLRHVAVPALGTGTGGLALDAFADECIASLQAVQRDGPCTISIVLWSDGDFATVARVAKARASP